MHSPIQRYEEWKNGMPDLKWLKDVMPDERQWDGMQRNMMNLRDSFKNTVELDPRIKQLGEDKMAEWRRWFDARLDDAIEAAATSTSAVDGVQQSRKCFAFGFGLGYTETGSHNSLATLSLSLSLTYSSSFSALNFVRRFIPEFV